MALTKNDLRQIRGIVKDEVDRGVGKLAITTKHSFDDIDKKLAILDKRLAIIEKELEQVRLRLDNAAYRFELIELQKRVARLENKVGLKG